MAQSAGSSAEERSLPYRGLLISLRKEGNRPTDRQHLWSYFTEYDKGSQGKARGSGKDELQKEKPLQIGQNSAILFLVKGNKLSAKRVGRLNPLFVVV